MKKLFLFLAMASTTMFVSCGSDDSEGGTPAATSVTLTASATEIDLGQPVTLTVKDNNGTDVTARATFFDGTTAITSPYTPTTSGAHSLTAKYDNLTSAAVVVTVNAVAEPNSIFVNGANSTITNSVFAIWGQLESGEILVSMLAFDVKSGTQAGDAIFAIADRNHYIDVEFLLPGDYDFSAGLPTNADSTFRNIFEVYVSGAKVTLEAASAGTINLGTFPAATNMPHAFDATATLGTTELEVNFNGNWLGVYDDTAEPAPRSASGGISTTNLKVISSKAQLDKIKANFIANLKK